MDTEKLEDLSKLSSGQMVDFINHVFRDDKEEEPLLEEANMCSAIFLSGFYNSSSNFVSFGVARVIVFTGVALYNFISTEHNFILYALCTSILIEFFASVLKSVLDASNFWDKSIKE